MWRRTRRLHDVWCRRRTTTSIRRHNDVAFDVARPRLLDVFGSRQKESPTTSQNDVYRPFTWRRHDVGTTSNFLEGFAVRVSGQDLSTIFSEVGWPNYIRYWENVGESSAFLTFLDFIYRWNASDSKGLWSKIRVRFRIFYSVVKKLREGSVKCRESIFQV